MSSIAQGFANLDRHPDQFTVEALAAVLPQRWICEAISVSGRASERIRHLPATLTLWMVILLGLFRRHSYVNLLELLFEAGRNRRLWAGHGVPSPSALIKARDRLGVQPVQQLFERSAAAWLSQTPGLEFHGHRVLALDGTCIKVPDSVENREHFGLPPSGRGRTAYPQARMISLCDVHTRLCIAARFGPFRRGEVTLARELLADVPVGALVVLDRNFLAYELLHDLVARGAEFLVRAKAGLRFRVVEVLGPGDGIVEIAQPAHWRNARPDLPSSWLFRMIRYLPPGGTEEVCLLTSLVFAEGLTRRELIDLYPQRWQEETGYRELKTQQCAATTITRPTVVRSKSPRRIRQEIYGLLIAYNAVRMTMADAAMQAGCPPTRISHTAALERIREAVRDMMQAATRRLCERYGHLMAALARLRVPARPGRHYPRAVKTKLSSYPVKAYARA